jgi:predicted metallopeptidase
MTSRDSRTAGFDFTAAMERLCGDMCLRLPELAHIDMSRVAVSFCQARKNVAHGLQAALTPLRFAEGATTMRRGKRVYGCQRVCDESGRDYLYVLSFYLPRYLNHPLEEKLSTVLHELWHISPSFDGDLRRHPGRCYAHGHSQQHYDDQVEILARRWLAMDPPYGVYSFLEATFDELLAQHGSVFGRRIRAPRLTRLDVS